MARRSESERSDSGGLGASLGFDEKAPTFGGGTDDTPIVPHLEEKQQELTATPKIEGVTNFSAFLHGLPEGNQIDTFKVRRRGNPTKYGLRNSVKKIRNTGEVGRIFNGYPIPPHIKRFLDSTFKIMISSFEGMNGKEFNDLNFEIFDAWHDACVKLAVNDLLTVQGELKTELINFYGKEEVNRLKRIVTETCTDQGLSTDRDFEVYMLKALLSSYQLSCISGATLELYNKDNKLAEKLGMVQHVEQGLVPVWLSLMRHGQQRDKSVIHEKKMDAIIAEYHWDNGVEEVDVEDSKDEVRDDEKADAIKSTQNIDSPRAQYYKALFNLHAAIATCPNTALQKQAKRVIAAVEDEANRASPNYPKLTRVLNVSTRFVRDPNNKRNSAALYKCAKSCRNWGIGKSVGLALLGLLGVGLIAASIAVAVASFGLASPLSALGIVKGMMILGLTGKVLGGAAVGVGAAATAGTAKLGHSVYKHNRFFKAVNGMETAANPNKLTADEITQSADEAAHDVTESTQNDNTM